MQEIEVQSDEKLIRLIMTVVPYKNHKGTFNAFQAVQKDKKLIDCRFRTEVVQPVASCYILVKIKNINLERDRLFPRLWVHKIEKIFYDDMDAEPETVTRERLKIDEVF